MGTSKRGAFSHSPRHSAIVAPLRDLALWNRHLLAFDTRRVPQFWLAYSFRGRYEKEEFDDKLISKNIDRQFDSRKSYTDREIHGFYSSEERNQPPSCPSERVLLSNRKYGRHKCVRCSESHLVPWHHPRYSYESKIRIHNSLHSFEWFTNKNSNSCSPWSSAWRPNSIQW